MLELQTTVILCSLFALLLGVLFAALYGVGALRWPGGHLGGFLTADQQALLSEVLRQHNMQKAAASLRDVVSKLPTEVSK